MIMKRNNYGKRYAKNETGTIYNAIHFTPQNIVSCVEFVYNIGMETSIIGETATVNEINKSGKLEISEDYAYGDFQIEAYFYDYIIEVMPNKFKVMKHLDFIRNYKRIESETDLIFLIGKLDPIKHTSIYSPYIEYTFNEAVKFAESFLDEMNLTKLQVTVFENDPVKYSWALIKACNKKSIELDFITVDNNIGVCYNVVKDDIRRSPEKIKNEFGYDKVYAFTGDIAIAILNGKYFHIDIEGLPLYDKTFDQVYAYNNKGIALAMLNGKDIYIDHNGNTVKL